MKTINLITGASGFLGQHLLHHLVSDRKETEVHAVDRTGLNLPGVTSHSCDLRSKEEVFALIEKIKPNRIYHLAGISRVSSDISLPDYFMGNTRPTELLCEALRRQNIPARFFLGSSVHVYGNQTQPVEESTALHPESPYAYSKYLAEQTVRHFGEAKDFGAVIARLYSCLGPGQKPGFVASDLCLKIRALPKEGTGVLKVGSLTSSRRFMDARDAVRAFPALLDQTPSGVEAYNIASTYEFQIQTLLDTLMKISGRKAKVESEATNPNAFKGLEVRIDKLKKTLPALSFRPIASSLKDMWDETESLA